MIKDVMRGDRENAHHVSRERRGEEDEKERGELNYL